MARLLIVEEGIETKHDLVEDEYLVGRHSDCTIQLTHPSVSGNHATIQCRTGDFFLQDLESRNGTSVNRVRIQELVSLNHNDMIQFGDAVARFDNPAAVTATQTTATVVSQSADRKAPLADESGTAIPAALPPASPTATVDVPTSGLVRLNDDREEDANIMGQVAGAGRFGVLDVNPEAKLRAVLKISQDLGGTVELNTLLPKILDTLFEIFKYADRGCILMKDNEVGQMVPRAMRHRHEAEDATVRLSRTIVDKVLREKTGILSADAAQDAAFAGNTSIADLKIRSMMCVPLLGLDSAPIGVLSMDNQNPLGQFTQDDLELLMTIAGQVALAYENGRLVEAYAAKQKQDHELQIARTVQYAILPADFPIADQKERCYLSAALEPALAVGGDFYDFFYIDDRRLCICIGDVSDKGVHSALFMAVAKTLIKSTAKNDSSPARILCHVNQELSENNDLCMFVTVFFGVLDVSSGDFVFTNAGHNPPYLVRSDGQIEQLDMRHGPAIGVVADISYGEGKMCLSGGDRLLLYTDGVTEATSEDGDFFTDERLAKLVARGLPETTSDTVKTILQEVHSFVGNAERADDITLLAVQLPKHD